MVCVLVCDSCAQQRLCMPIARYHRATFIADRLALRGCKRVLPESWREGPELLGPSARAVGHRILTPSHELSGQSLPKTGPGSLAREAETPFSNPKYAVLARNSFWREGWADGSTFGDGLRSPHRLRPSAGAKHSWPVCFVSSSGDTTTYRLLCLRSPCQCHNSFCVWPLLDTIERCSPFIVFAL